MNIITKYNIGDVVWGEWYMEITRFKVTGVGIIVEGNITSILYDLEDTQDYTNDASMTEEYLFPTKEELLKSL
jgi:hypothetical protein